VALRAVFFDVGETLVDETGSWERTADACGVPRFTFMSLLGALVARGEHHSGVYELFGVERPAVAGFRPDELYPDALPCLRALRRRGLKVGAAGNMRIIDEDVLRGHVDVVGSSERWEVEKPSPGFFARISAEGGGVASEIAYVGDRVDNDVTPARAAGMLAVHIRRGPWGYLHDASGADLCVDSLAQLPEALAGV
jgi:FMN phosphatase YigB (HAD superfamily)